jgi:hypothetical protein
VSVHISELEVQPREADAQRGQQQGRPAAAAGAPHAPSPELDRQIATAVAILHSRNRRLIAD